MLSMQQVRSTVFKKLLDCSRSKSYRSGYREQKIYVSSFTNGKVVKIDIKTGNIEKSWNIGLVIRAIHYAPKSKRVFATSQCGIFELVDK